MIYSPFAGKLPERTQLVDIPKLIRAYYTGIPDTDVREQRVSFGTSGHRGSSLTTTFNERHILAITQAVCLHRSSQKINGPVFLGFDTHALSAPAFASVMEVLAANVSRNHSKSIFQIGVFSNKYIIGSIALGICLQLMILFIPFMRNAFHLQLLDLKSWCVLIGLSLVLMLLNELFKIGIRAKNKKAV